MSVMAIRPIEEADDPKACSMRSLTEEEEEQRSLLLLHAATMSL